MRTIRIQVKPGSRQDNITQQTNGEYLVRVKLSQLMAKLTKQSSNYCPIHFRIAKTRFQIKNGASSHHKTVVIDN